MPTDGVPAAPLPGDTGRAALSHEQDPGKKLFLGQRSASAPVPFCFGELLWHKQGLAAAAWTIALCAFSAEVLKRLNANEC